MQSEISFADCTAKTAALCQQASAAVLHFYHGGASLGITEKDNHTPLTLADLAAHDILVKNLPDIVPIPVISEESVQSVHNDSHEDYWLIDPIDGTREFINRTGEFCICVARIQSGRPTFGMIYAPITGEYWYAGKNQGAFKKAADGTTAALHCRTIASPPAIITAQYRFSNRLRSYLEAAIGAFSCQRKASALKFCAIAEGKADIYPKISATTSEWDTAAGDILLTEAGGGIRYWDNTLMRYGSRDTTLNPPFLAFGAGVDDAKLAEYFAVMEAQFARENRQPLN